MKEEKKAIKSETSLIQKVQSLPEQKRKQILWALIIITGIIFFFFYIKNVQKKLKNYRIEKTGEELQLSPLKDELKNLLEIETPQELK